MRAAILLLVCALSLHASDAPGLSELDREKLRRSQLQLELLQRQVVEAQGPIMREQSEILDRVCSASGLKREECQVNIETGAVTKAKLPEPPKEDKK